MGLYDLNFLVKFVKFKESSMYLFDPGIPHSLLQELKGGWKKGLSLDSSSIKRLTSKLDKEKIEQTGYGNFGITKNLLEDTLDSHTKTKEFFLRQDIGANIVGQLYSIFQYNIASSALEMCTLLWNEVQDGNPCCIPSDGFDPLLLIDECNKFTSCLLRKIHIAYHGAALPDPDRLRDFDIKRIYDCWSGKAMDDVNLERSLREVTTFADLLSDYRESHKLKKVT